MPNRPRTLSRIRDAAEGRRGARRAVELFPEFKGWSSAGTVRRLIGPYEQYVTSVSSPEMAMSLETAVMISDFCDWIRPARILDLGSGFSSFVLRDRARTYQGQVVSIDDSDEWLERSRRFVSDQGVDASNMFSLEAFLASNSGTYEFVFHDLGNMSTRAAVLPAVIEHVSVGGMLFLDDLHKPAYAQTARRLLGGAGLQVVSLRRFTIDRFGRFVGLAIPAHQRALEAS